MENAKEQFVNTIIDALMSIYLRPEDLSANSDEQEALKQVEEQALTHGINKAHYDAINSVCKRNAAYELWLQNRMKPTIPNQILLYKAMDRLTHEERQRIEDKILLEIQRQRTKEQISNLTK